MGLKGIAKQVLGILDEGAYTSHSGVRVVIADAVEHARSRTRLLTPDALAALGIPNEQRATTIEVTGETTQVAAHRLVVNENEERVCVLNFASARNPGGGFLGGARAQEEDVCRCSALYPCLLEAPTYYEVNRAHPNSIYTDHLIYTPDVPFFKVKGRGELLDEPFLVSVLTAPAPNTGAVLKRDPDAKPALREAFQRRTHYVLAAMAEREHSVIVLGAWGCGAFRGDPEMVADIFGNLLEGEFKGVFERVVFPVFDPRESEPNRVAFAARLAT